MNVNLTFRNGAVDDAAFQRDRIYLYGESGTDRLLQNLDLPKQAVRREQWVPPHRQVAISSSERHSRANNTGASPAPPDNAWKVVSRQNRHRHNLGKYGTCGEKNHITAVCKHVSKVRCRQCGELRHNMNWPRNFHRTFERLICVAQLHNFYISIFTSPQKW